MKPMTPLHKTITILSGMLLAYFLYALNIQNSGYLDLDRLSNLGYFAMFASIAWLIYTAVGGRL